MTIEQWAQTAIVFAITIVFLIGNRWCGGGFGWNELAAKRILRGRPIYYFGLFSMILLGAMFGLPGVMAALTFLIWRLPGWYGAIDAGTDKHSALRDFAVMGARALPFAVLGLLAPGAPYFPLVALVLAIPASYHVAWHIGKRSEDPVADAEMIAGAFIGAAIGLFLVGA